jgi:hypothetical protein
MIYNGFEEIAQIVEVIRELFSDTKVFILIAEVFIGRKNFSFRSQKSSVVGESFYFL